MTNLATRYPEKIRLKIGSKIIAVPASTIQLISTDKAYTAVYTSGRRILDNKSLKEFQTKLDPNMENTFLMYNRSNIIDKYVGLEPNQQNFNKIMKSLDHSGNDYFRLSRPNQEQGLHTIYNKNNSSFGTQAKLFFLYLRFDIIRNVRVSKPVTT